MAITQKITSNLWFDKEAEAAAVFYTSVFKNSRTGQKSYYGKEGQDIHGMKEGTLMTVEFWLNGQQFVALNGGPHFKFNEAISFIVNCDTQEEIDYYWDKLREGGDEKAQVCGWLKDKYGVSWQIVPVILPKMMASIDRKKAESAMKVMLKMKKLDIAMLKEAFDEAE